MHFKYYDDLNTFDDLKYYLSQEESAFAIERDFFEVAEHLMKKKSPNAFSLFLEHFHHKIIDGEYRPSPAYHHVHDLFLKAAKQPDYSIWIDTLYQNGYDPVIKNPDKIKYGELISKLFQEKLYEQLDYLIEKHNFPKTISKEDVLNHFVTICIQKDPVSFEKFEPYKIYIPLDKKEHLYSNIRDENIDNILKLLSLLKQSELYSKDIASYEEDKSTLFLQIIINNNLSLESIQKFKDYFNIYHIEPLSFKEVLEPCFSRRDGIESIFTDLNKLKNLHSLGLDDYLSENVEMSKTIRYAFISSFTSTLSHKIDKTPLSLSQFTSLIPYYPLAEYSNKKQEVLLSNFMYHFKNHQDTSKTEDFINFVFNGQVDLVFLDDKLFNNRQVNYNFSEESLERMRSLIHSLSEKKEIISLINNTDNNSPATTKKRL